MKRCLLVCEGPFDELVFSILRDCFDDSILEIKALGSCCVDIPDLKSNIKTVISEMLAKEHGYSIEDFDEICFLIDTDGIYILDSQIVENSSLKVTNYKRESIECPDKKSIVLRNIKRRKNIDELLE
ncbi:MAG: hypothetical protein HUJ61_02340, partial [Bacilli bacterium]|nr:hypothetical protein [Bacilli bacterium]